MRLGSAKRSREACRLIEQLATAQTFPRLIAAEHRDVSMKAGMNRKHKPILVAVCLIALGSAWLLNNIGVMPGVNWVWTLGLAAVAIVILPASGIDKLTVVIVPLLLLASIASVLRQTGRITGNYEVPGLVIAAGVLILISHLSPLPPAAWLEPEPPVKS